LTRSPIFEARWEKKQVPRRQGNQGLGMTTCWLVAAWFTPEASSLTTGKPFGWAQSRLENRKSATGKGGVSSERVTVFGILEGSPVAGRWPLIAAIPVGHARARLQERETLRSGRGRD